VAATLLRAVMGRLFDAAGEWFDYEGNEPHEALRRALRGVEVAWRDHAPIVNCAVEGWRSDPGDR